PDRFMRSAAAVAALSARLPRAPAVVNSHRRSSPASAPHDALLVRFGPPADQATIGGMPVSLTMGSLCASHAGMPPPTLTAARPSRLSQAATWSERPPTRHTT